MTPNDLAAALNGLQTVTASLKDLVGGPNSVTHVVRQLMIALEEMRRGAAPAAVQLEENVTGKVRGSRGVINIDRDVDVMSERIINGVLTKIHIETKTGEKSITSALDKDQLKQDAALAILAGIEEGRSKLVNVWDLSNFNVTTPENQLVMEAKLSKLRDDLISKGFSDERVRAAMSSFNFTDKFGNAVQAEMNEQGDIIFKPAMKELFGAEGIVTKAAEKEVGNSPDFTAAMKWLFGSGGTLAEAATDAARQTDLDPSLNNLETKLEDGLETAMDKAGDAAKEHAAVSLGSQVKEGVGALGSTLSAIGGLGTSVMALGAAWDKPNKGAADYFGLMSQLGGTISQAVSAVDAIGKLASVTKIASAAQAVFNAIMAMNPIVLIIIAVIALIAAIVALIVYWDEVKAALRDNPWLAVVAALFGVIGVIVLVIAYWDEIKLAVLIAANFISIQIQKIGAFFVGLKNLIGMVWDWITGSVYNLGASIINAFIEFGASIINFFVDLINDFIGIYNDIAEWVPGLDTISEVERVNVDAIKVSMKDVPEVDPAKAFADTDKITGGLEDQIAKQEAVVQKAHEEDKMRQDQAAAAKAEKEQAAAAAAPPAAMPAFPAAGAGGLAAPPTLPAGAAALPGAAAADQSIHVEGGIHVTITAEHLDGDSAKMLTDEMVRQLQERLDALRSERDRRMGVRAQAAA